ncbi:MAG: hypothetical protein IPH62_02670 [Ignavibacteriae bacterium]|nr:hypothetical protein [Ignavibacteriota bacterium]
MLKVVFFLFIILANNIANYGQEDKDYKKLFKDYLKTIEEDQQKIPDFFISMDDDELEIAMDEISQDEDVNFIAHKVFIPNKKRFDEGKFRKKLIKELSKKKNNPNYQYVLISFVAKYNKKDDEYLEDFNDELYKLAESGDIEDNVRYYASAKYGISNDFEKSHKNLEKLFKSNNFNVKNGVAKSLTRFLYTSKISNSEKEKWENLLIEEINKNKDSLKNVSSLISTLSQTKSTKSKDFILKLFKENTRKNPEKASFLVNYLQNEVDSDIFKNIFKEYSNFNHFDNFGAELQLKQLVNENTDLIEEFYNKKDDESKIYFLKAVRHVKEAKFADYLEKVKESLKSNSETERLESVKTLHFLLSQENEINLFKNHLKNEDSYLVKSQIYSYIGE